MFYRKLLLKYVLLLNSGCLIFLAGDLKTQHTTEAGRGQLQTNGWNKIKFIQHIGTYLTALLKGFIILIMAQLHLSKRIPFSKVYLFGN